MTQPLSQARTDGSLLARAIESDRQYFEMGAELTPIDGATLAWMPGLTRSPAAAVIHRVDPEAIADGGTSWSANAEAAMTGVGARLCRIYLDSRHDRADEVLRGEGYIARDELFFFDSLPDLEIPLALRPVASGLDWAEKLRFHEATDGTPDGHGNLAADWVELERRKCGDGMETFLAELDGETIGAIGAIWCGDFVRAKNLIVAERHRRRGIGRAIIGSLAALGRRRGVPDQCFVAVSGEQGERLYRSAGMAKIGFQVEWSKPIAEEIR